MFNIIESIIIASIGSLFALLLMNLFRVISPIHIDNPLYEGDEPFTVKQLSFLKQQGFDISLLDEDLPISEEDDEDEYLYMSDENDVTYEEESEEYISDDIEYNDLSGDIEYEENLSHSDYDESPSWHSDQYNDYDDNEYERLQNIKILSKSLAPILEKHNKSEPLKVKVLIHEMVSNLALNEETTNKVINHFNEEKIKELQNLLHSYTREIALTDDSILVNRLDRLDELAQ